MAKARKKVTKVKKKHWFEIVAPRSFGEQILGEAYVSESELLHGRKLSLNLKCFSQKGGRRKISVGFKVKDVKEGRAYCQLISYRLLYASVKRLISRGKNKAHESFVARSKDGKDVRVKIILVTIKKTTNSVMTALRNQMESVVRDRLNSMKYEDFLMQTIEHKLQFELRSEAAKIYPLRSFEIQSISLENLNDDGEEEQIVVEETPLKKEEPKKTPKENKEDEKEKEDKKEMKEEEEKKKITKKKKKSSSKKSSKTKSKKSASKKSKKTKKSEPKDK